MKRKLTVAAALGLLLLATMAMTAPAAAAGASFIDYTSSEVMVGGPVITGVTPCGNGVLKVTMANHFHDFNASHPWGNADVDTKASLVVHTVDGDWVSANTMGTYRSEGDWGVQVGSFTGSVSFVTGVTVYRFCGKGVSGDVAGTLWRGSAYCPGMGDPITQMTVRIVIP